jgi:sulfotransferase family protein
MEELKNIPIFFVVGRPRSGTTLLRMLFDAHPNINFPPECQFIINLYPKYGNISNWTEDLLIQFYDDLVDEWFFDTWSMDNDALKSRLLEYVGNYSYGTICKLIYSEYKSLYDKEELMLLGDKNPGYAIYTKTLLKIFPEAKFIQILRDYRDNYVSIRNVDFELPVPSIVGQKWKYFFKKFRKDSKIKPSSYFTINYEKFVKDPEIHFQEICDFIGISYTEKVFNFREKKDEFLKHYPPGYIHNYHSSLLKKINTDKIEVWRKQLTKQQLKILDATVGKIAEQSGYKREYKNTNIWICLLALPGRVYAAILYLATIIVDLFPYKLRTAILIKGPLLLSKIYLFTFNRKKYRELEHIIIKRK